MSDSVSPRLVTVDMTTGLRGRLLDAGEIQPVPADEERAMREVAHEHLEADPERQLTTEELVELWRTAR